MSYSSLIESSDDALNVLKAILDNTVDGLITIDERGKILGINQAGHRIFGYTDEECLGRNVSMLMPEKTQVAHDGYLQAYMNGGPPKIIGIGREVEGRRKNGEVFPLDLSVARTEFKGTVIFTGIVRDLTRRRAAEAALKEKTETIERFSFLASHDLKEPLRTIEAFTDILVQEYKSQLEPEAQEYLGIVSDSAKRMRMLVNDLLEFARYETEPEMHEEFEARAEIDAVLRGLKDVAKDSGLRVEVGRMPRLRGNRIRFHRLMLNLISNALKYRDPNRAPQIIIEANNIEPCCVFTVADNGIGIAPEHQNQVFELFRRLHGRDAYSGTGVGLAICKRIVEHWGGRMWVESEAGRGSMFCFTIPSTAIVVSNSDALHESIA